VRTDGEYISLCLDGHPDAYRELVARYQAPLVAYMAGRLGDAALADEAAHEAFVRAYYALGKLRKRESFFPWLVGIADRVAKEERRFRSRHAELDESLPAPSGSSPAEVVDLERAVARLAEPYRETVLLCYYGGFSCAETAERLGVPLGTVTKRLSRAYAVLREKLEGGSSRAATMEVRR
jgi:RNA polymerase sigma-70 factor, ECF subfamily